MAADAEGAYIAAKADATATKATLDLAKKATAAANVAFSVDDKVKNSIDYANSVLTGEKNTVNMYNLRHMVGQWRG